MATQGAPHAKGALEGVKVVDMTRYGAGPICTQVLGDMGAEVVKVEPLGGDASRFNPPLKDDIGGYFHMFNRNKKSVTLDLRAQRGKELFRGLVRWTDILVENFRPGTMADLGFGYEQVQQINPRVIMVSVSGFGQTGPYAHRPAFDGVVQAMSGLMSVTGFPDREPVKPGPPIADMTGGFIATIGALTALLHQRATGEGQHVDAAMYEGLFVHMATIIGRHARGLRVPRGESPGVAPFGTFLTQDQRYVYIMAHDNNHWPHMARLMGRPDLVDHPDYKTRAARGKRAKELNAMVSEWVAAKSAAQVEAELDRCGIPFGRVQDVDDVLRDPHARQRGAIVDVDHYGELLPLVGVVPKLSKTPGSIRSVAPHVGQHNEEVYCGTLGLPRAEFEELKRAKVI